MLHVELTRALECLRAAPDVRAVVLASTGRYFSAGGDFELMMECRASMSNRLRIVDDGRKLFATLVDLPQPIVVALHGGRDWTRSFGRACLRRHRCRERSLTSAIHTFS